MTVRKRIVERRVLGDRTADCSDKTVFINRVTKVVKGGKRFSFTALIVSGDGRGHVGFGLGKAAEVPEAIRKGGEKARKSLVRVPLVGSTIPHDIEGRCGASRVIMKPAPPGTGVIAGAAVRIVAESLGLRDVRTKIIGSSNPYTVLAATFDALLGLRDPGTALAARGKTIEEVGYAAF